MSPSARPCSTDLCLMRIPRFVITSSRPFVITHSRRSIRSFRTGLRGRRSSCWTLRGRPGRRDVYIRAFDASVTLHVAGYNYSGTWAISTGGTLTRWNGS
jgi:hypothetical protein